MGVTPGLLLLAPLSTRTVLRDTLNKYLMDNVLLGELGIASWGSEQVTVSCSLNLNISLENV